MNNKTPLISVLLPVYNVEPYIKDCLDSILNQTIQDFEIILIDDYSTDNTLTIVESYRDIRIKVYKKSKNKGLIDSLNIGFEVAKGKYIARMDGDDICKLDRFEKQLKVLEQNNEIILCGSWKKHFGRREKIEKHSEFHDEIISKMLIHCSLSFGTSMFKREIIDTSQFDKTKLHVEDYDFLSRIAWQGKFYNIQEVLYYYREHENQVSTVYKEIQIQGDIPIKLFLFKKIGYDETIYQDDFIKKMLLLNRNIEVYELELFLKWLKELVKLNVKSKVYSQKELEIVLTKIKKKTLFKLYFKRTTIGITKEWRIKGLFKMSLLDSLYILKLKSKEFIKFYLR
ncbi:MAG: glycosyltransferase family 2 protein [Bacteroidetes bacterium]|nr:glycosyltransferase family 2 protein [Bacteroidota bacterium]